MPTAKRLIAAALTKEQHIYRKALDDILYYLKRNMIAYRSHRKKALRRLVLGEIDAKIRYSIKQTRPNY